ncbi:MAG: hypothetical protein L0Y39_00680 [Methylococcaceae bacterium]|nr:hypothetical protein [Methylococcaceae bacterium]
MIKALNSLLAALFFVIVSGIAAENDPVQDWGNVDGVTVQPDERVEQINANKKKLQEAEKKKLEKFWKQKGITVQSEQRVQDLNERDKKRREKEIRELKCRMCKLRCDIVRDAGQAICTSSEAPTESEQCAEQAENFLKTCLQQCEHC